MISTLLNIPHAEWIEEGTCGAACAQMVLRVSDTPKETQQAVIYCERCHLQGSNCRTGPNGLSATLIDKDRANSMHYQPVTAGSQETLSRHMCWMMVKTGRAPIAMVNGGSHWIVVSGCITDLPAMFSSDRGYSIESFRIQDPAVPRKANSKSLQMHQDVTWEQWVSSYLWSPVASDEPELLTYVDKWVAIGDIIPPGDVRIELPFTSTPSAIPTTDLGISENQAIDIAMQVLERPSYVEDKTWRELINRDILPIEPLIRWRDLRTPEKVTYFVPFRDQGTPVECPDIPIVIQIDASNGDYLELAVVPEGSLYLGDVPEMLDPQRVADRFNRQGFVDLLNESATVTRQIFYPIDAVNDWESELFWTPSQISLTPFLPFYRLEFVVGGGTTESSSRSGTSDGIVVTVYLRLDGSYFFKLDERIYGW